MSDRSRIEWTDATWNPVTGCSKVSPGCERCYAERLSHRFGWTTKPWTAPHAAENVQLDRLRVMQPLHWRKPRRIFVNSMSDLFHDQVPDAFLAEVFATIQSAPRHLFQVLTKRPARMQAWMLDPPQSLLQPDGAGWPPPNLWLGVSVEDQRRANERIPLLLQTPAVVRFVSCEPLLGPLDLTPWLHRLDWVIVGAESGPGARPMDDAWVRALRDQCQAAQVAFWFKQRADIYGRKQLSPVLDGRLWHEWPAAGRNRSR